MLRRAEWVILVVLLARYHLVISTLIVHRRWALLGCYMMFRMHSYLVLLMGRWMTHWRAVRHMIWRCANVLRRRRTHAHSLLVHLIVLLRGDVALVHERSMRVLRCVYLLLVHHLLLMMGWWMLMMVAMVDWWRPMMGMVH